MVRDKMFTRNLVLHAEKLEKFSLRSFKKNSNSVDKIYFRDFTTLTHLNLVDNVAVLLFALGHLLEGFLTVRVDEHS